MIEADLVRLVDDAVPEGRNIEYKSMFNLETVEHRKTFLKQVSALANTEGGHLFFGIKEDKGIPVEIPGINVDDTDGLKLRVENLVRDGIEPRIQGLQLAVVPLSNGRLVLVLRIPRSWNPPHMIRFQDHGKFYARNSAGIFALDVSGLRAAFLQSSTVIEKARQFRLGRLTRIKAGESPLGESPGASSVLHLIPLQALNLGQQIDMRPVLDHTAQIPQIGRQGSHDQRFTLDGYLLTSRRGSGQCYSYTLLFREGIVESVDSGALAPHGERKLIGHEQFEDALLRAVRQFQKFMPAVGLHAPYIVAFTMLNVRGYSLAVAPGQDFIPIDRDDLLIPEALSDLDNETPTALLRPVFDRVWNACGFLRSMSYDEHGTWCR